ncbi:hypothetical protein B5T_00136 [Alloalcanivorax dieselolei B5]|uniref:DUF4190 domain-containing protein n=1 Tax=Alcanivorax dieselolei (strain DSM 16502 / CGMCC 1.3690 / MCCC 1A00001 / B-5) TaxID=930169 RepID=K0C4X5_ALCDB|nr:hypothetical protein [Alloalcanivorax dieselolei]AFT68424.1 hypothetical protein B5T_00136 [Alloalcanivorax dieselolei B5]GGJ99788.1 hypothetical protein GCM10007426_31150 [Alloalcanivorax dieselolei]
MSDPGQALVALMYALPLLIPAIIGVVLGAINMQRARKAAVLVIIASVLLFLEGGYNVVSQLFIMPLISGAESWEVFGAINGGVYAILTLSATILLISAAFVGREKSQTAAAYQDADAGLSHVPPQLAQAPNHRGALVLTLGLISLLVFQPLGIAPWVIGVQDLRAMREGRMDPEGRSTTLAGMVLGIIAIVLFVLGLIAIGFFIAALANTNWSY